MINESSIWLTAKILFLFIARARDFSKIGIGRKHNIPGEQNFPRDAVGSDSNVIDASTARALDAAGGD